MVINFRGITNRYQEITSTKAVAPTFSIEVNTVLAGYGCVNETLDRGRAVFRKSVLPRKISAS